MFALEKMEPASTRIPARSKEQVMDWSLVLLSQGIESHLDHSEAEGWSLLVAGGDSQQALKNLRQYRAENRGWPWRRPLGGASARFDFSCLIWVGLLIVFHWAASVVPGLTDAGIMNSRAVQSGQWWRIFTAMTLHADVGHLATNLSLGIVLFGLAMGRFGSGRGLLAAYLAGAVGNVASLLLTPKPFHGLGASGMIMGALGLLAAPWFSPRREERIEGKSLRIPPVRQPEILNGSSRGTGRANGPLSPTLSPSEGAREETHARGVFGWFKGSMRESFGAISPRLLGRARRGTSPPSIPQEAREKTSRREIIGTTGAGVMIFLLYGMTPGTDMAAHGGGFVAGLVLGFLLTHAPPWLAKNPLADSVCVTFLTTLVSMTWWLARTAGH